MESLGRIFVSSTCYDLLDLRTVLELRLKEAGLRPVMSDSRTSEFVADGSANSIETCLVNLRNCERCIVVLSQRYGPSLEKAGFESISATHLEYREAIRYGIPVTVYVRDQLWAEFRLWEKNKQDHKFRWTKPEDRSQLFAFLAEHSELQNPNKNKNNWVWQFTSVVDLCDRVLADLGSMASSAMVRTLTSQGRLPLLSIVYTGSSTTDCHLRLWNVGHVPALRVGVRDELGTVICAADDMPSGHSKEFRWKRNLSGLSLRDGYGPVLRVDYEIPSGERLCDLFAILPAESGRVRFVPAGRQFVCPSLRVSSPEIVPHGGYSLIDLEPINRAHAQNAL